MRSRKWLVAALLAAVLCCVGAAALAEQNIEAPAPIAVGQIFKFNVEGSFQSVRSPVVIDVTQKPMAYRMFQYADGTKNLSTDIEIAFNVKSWNCVRAADGTYWGNYSVDLQLKPLKGTPAGEYYGEITFQAPSVKVCTVSFSVKPAANGLLHDSNSGADYLVSSNGKNLSLKALNNSNKKAFTIPANVTVGTVKYPVTKVEANALKGNKKLTTLVIGKNVTSIGNYAFKNCTALTKVSGGTGLVTLGRGVFYLDKKLTSVNLGTKLKTIGVQAFYKCSSLAKVTIPLNVTKIATQAFYGNTKLKSVIIKTPKLTYGSIGKNAFGGTPNPTFQVPAGKETLYKALLKASGVPVDERALIIAR
ncbi:MAG: leucine-rich repeat domain-containing protein [Clostridia bacterium]|nr:leucine-rich repeat domain-containing protein [Clostridia bacterium]